MQDSLVSLSSSWRQDLGGIPHLELLLEEVFDGLVDSEVSGLQAVGVIGWDKVLSSSIFVTASVR